MFKSKLNQNQNNENNDLEYDFYQSEEYLQILKGLKERDNRKNDKYFLKRRSYQNFKIHK